MSRQVRRGDAEGRGEDNTSPRGISRLGGGQRPRPTVPNLSAGCQHKGDFGLFYLLGGAPLDKLGINGDHALQQPARRSAFTVQRSTFNVQQPSRWFTRLWRACLRPRTATVQNLREGISRIIRAIWSAVVIGFGARALKRVARPEAATAV